MKVSTIANELNSLAYHGRGIIIGKSADGKKAVTAYFIMGRSVNSRNRVFVAEQHWALSIVSILAILVGAKRYCIVVLYLFCLPLNLCAMAITVRGISI